MDSDSEIDYLVVGGGTAGCVVASRLSQAGFTVCVLEAGPEDYSEKIMSPLAAPTLHGSHLEFNYLSKEQAWLGNRRVPNFGGRLLSGSSAVNYANWTRCHSTDYDDWANLVGDKRWSYQGLLPFFNKVDSVMQISASARNYPLKETLEKALEEAGIEFNPNANGGDPLGFASMSENWKDGKRQPAGKAYDLSKATIHTVSYVKRIIIDNGLCAQGVELLDGQIITARKEVLVCCGSIKTPQLLMLSGIGPVNHLSEHGITPVVDLPVGEGLHDHLSATLYWKLRNPEEGYAIGSPLFAEKVPNFKDGNPIDWIVTQSIGRSPPVLDVEALNLESPGVTQPRGQYEFFISYAPIAAPIFFDYSLAGTHISTPVLGLLPTSRGSVTLASTDPYAEPLIDPNYLESGIDRDAMRAGVRTVLRTMLETASGRSIIEKETPPPGLMPLSSTSTNEEVDSRLKTIGMSFYQCAGTAAMGKVVDSSLKVRGISKLRVIDASILPLPLAGHYQYPVYAIAESAADLIVG